mmetsp:Transcript_7084/g.13026  ORF Transcript_7084/g.13026 Transcript_7084/m.13026 type:complete len:567 (-) Transcript_7084:198-1898(-)
MASFIASSTVRRFVSSSGFAGGVLVAAAGVVASISSPLSWLDDTNANNYSTKVSCQAAPSASPGTKSALDKSTLRTRMTCVGRFSLESETSTNPSIPTFFVALAGNKPFTAHSFAQLWKDRGMQDLHPRFHHVVSPTHVGYFEPNTEELDIQDALPPMIYRNDLKHRIQACLTHPLNVNDALWQVQISSGILGSSGAIPGNKVELLRQEFPYFKESILLFRGHHALADGVSLTAAFGDLCDEAQELRDAVHHEVKRRMGRNKTILQRLQLYLKRLVWFLHGSVQATLHHVYLLLFTPNNPFSELQDLLQTEINQTDGRTVSWCDAAPLNQVKQVAKSMGKSVTINDVMVSCVTYAVAKQLEFHKTRLQATHPDNAILKRVHNTINVVIPVHLGGGVLLPGQSVGNNLGAFCAQVPGEGTIGAEVRLQHVHESLHTVKNTPAPLLSYMLARVATSCFPISLKQWLFTSAITQSHACVAITNNRGSPRELHLDGQAIVSMAGFLPLPPSIPIGVSITSYNGEISLSVTAEPWAVPDSDLFLKWMLEEYARLEKITKAEEKTKGGRTYF